MPAAAQARHPLWISFLVGLVLVVSSQYALRDPRTQVLPVGFLPDAFICTFQGGASHTQPTPTPTHTHQPHCPLCIIGGFSDGALPIVSVPRPVPQAGVRPEPLEAPRPHLRPAFPLLNRGPPLPV
ncbi:hypothetical protein [Meiothermus sp.]|uniref:hypothetical protein n=1 Tax=Meiothermus sp. TaxID=1955249 RepID=UPI0021DDC47F|nr:hypothetical protein [Meiothermus sp.]GIW34156.1 MAG: hypothetical protein KatS3mg072_1489 [Meiothermus sp.]